MTQVVSLPSISQSQKDTLMLEAAVTGSPSRPKRQRRTRTTAPSSGLPLPVESVSAAVVSEKPKGPKAPEQLAKMLAEGCRFSSKALVIVLLDLEEKYVMTAGEAKAIADPAARMLMRIKALRKPIKWVTGNSDELALIAALGSYGMRLVDPISIKIDNARTAGEMRKQLEQKESMQRGTQRPTPAPVPARNPGSNKPPVNTAGANGHAGSGLDFAGFASEPVEAGSFIIPGFGIGFSQ